MSKNEITYQANGQDVTLTPSIVKQFVTKGNAEITTEEAFNFMQLCKYQGLNPFVGDSYLIKFRGKPAQQVVSKEAQLKKANRNPAFDGMESGIVVYSKDEVKHKEGQTLYPGENLLGGWARVYRSDRKIPTYVEVSLQEFNKNQATWNSMPSNMIRKVAQSHALREAFPDDLGSMLIEEEPHITDDGPDTSPPLREAEREDAKSSLLADFKKSVGEDQPEEENASSEPEGADNEPEEVEVEVVSEEESSMDWSTVATDKIIQSLTNNGVTLTGEETREELIEKSESFLEMKRQVESMQEAEQGSLDIDMSKVAGSRD